jgi:hypothetical protein
VEEHRIPWRGLEPVQVLDADYAAGAETLGGHVHEEPSRDDLRDGLGAQSVRAPVLRQLRDRVPVVGAVADLQVTQTVEVRAELLGRVLHADHPVHAVVTDPTTVLVMGRGDERLVEVPSREYGHVLVEHVREVVHPTLAHEPESGGALGVVDVVEHPDLVVGPELRGPPGGGAV